GERYGHGYGLFRAWCRYVGRPVEPPSAALAAYADYLEAEIPSNARRRLHALYMALVVLFPNEDWSWLLQHLRRCSGRSKPAAGTRAHPASPLMSLVFEEWPFKDQERWQCNLAPPAAGGSRLERLAARRRDLTGTPASVGPAG